MMAFKVYASDKNKDAHFSVASDNADFDVFNVTINNQEQQCFDNKNKDVVIWPTDPEEAPETQTSTVPPKVHGRKSYVVHIPDMPDCGAKLHVGLLAFVSIVLKFIIA